MRRFCWSNGGGLAMFWLGSLSACSSHPPAAAAPPENPATPGALLTSTASAPADPGTPPAASTAPQPSAQSAAVPEASAKICGGIAGFRCPEKQYCAFAPEARCGAGDMSGVCRPVPDLCTLEFRPVCGCDDKTYPSICVAARSGVSVATKGACPGDARAALPDGNVCGTRGVNGECGASSYCAFRAQCGATDAGGVCTTRPEICNDLFSPVCGCDGKTYPNDCHAARAGVSVATRAKCKND